jgi:hypothetical protein
MNTKHCEQLKQAALQFPWAGRCSSGNIGCQTVYVENTRHTAQHSAKYTFANSVEFNLLCAYFLFFLFSHLKKRSFISLFDLAWIFLVHQYWYCVAILRRYNFDPLWDYHIIVLVFI